MTARIAPTETRDMVRPISVSHCCGMRGRPVGEPPTLPLAASVMHISVALADGEKHGYAILRDVAELSGGAVRMGSGTLHGSIR